MQSENNTLSLKQKIKELLQHMGFEAEVFERMEEGRVVFNIKTSDAYLLIGKQGANLEALQHIVRLLVRDQLPEERFSFALDLDDYKDKRVIYLKELARKAAHHVRDRRRSVALAPMSASERRVIHGYLSLFSDLSSQSTGLEPNRRVVISLRSKQESSRDEFDFIENS